MNLSVQAVISAKLSVLNAQDLSQRQSCKTTLIRVKDWQKMIKTKSDVVDYSPTFSWLKQMKTQIFLMTRNSLFPCLKLNM